MIVLDSGCSSGDLTAAELAKWIHRSVLIPIVFFTGKVTPELEAVANQVQAVVVTKPDVGLLIESVKKAERG